MEQRSAGLTAVRREFDGPSFRVENPPKDQLSRCPATVAVAELLDRDGFVAELGRLRCVKDVVDGVEKVILLPGQPGGPALPEQDEVIDKHVGMCYGKLVGGIGEMTRSRGLGLSNSSPRCHVIMRRGKGA